MLNQQIPKSAMLTLLPLLFVQGAMAGDVATLFLPSLSNNNNSQITSYRQKVCDRYVSDGSTELQHALSGLALRPILTVGKFFHYNTDADDDAVVGIDTEDPGLAVLILDELATRANFTWRESFAVSYGPRLNQTWTEMLIEHTEVFDISVDYWDKSSERLNKGVAFLDRWFDGSMILVEKIIPPEDKDQVNYTNYLRPFTTNVWLAVLLTIMVSALIYQLLEYLAHERDDRSFWQWYKDNLFLSSMNFSQNHMYEPVSSASRIFGFSMAIWAMVLGATYTANLASLFVEEIGAPTKTQDIDEAIRLKKRICTWQGTNADLYLGRRYNQAIRIPKATELEAYQGLHTKECDLTLGASQSWQGYEMDGNYNTYCDLEWVGRTIEEVSSAFAVKADPALKCTNLIRDVLNYHLNEMASDDTLDNLWNDYYEANMNMDCNTYEATDNVDDESTEELEVTRYLISMAMPKNDQNAPRQLKSGGGAAIAAASAGGDEDDPESSSLTMKSMAGTFVLHAVLSGVAILVGIGSWYQSKKKKRKEMVVVNQNNIVSGNENELFANDSTEVMTDESTNVAGWSMASGTACNRNNNRGGVDSFVPREQQVQRQLQTLQASQQQLQEQQQEMSQQMSQMLSILTKMQHSGQQY